MKIKRLKDTVWLSHTGNNHIQDLKDAVIRMVLAGPDNPEEANNAYAALKMREREISEYVEVLEAAVGIKRPIVRRF